MGIAVVLNKTRDGNGPGKDTVFYSMSWIFQKFSCQVLDIDEKFNPIFDIMPDSALFSPLLEVPVSSSFQ
jgi:hypothetical protein